MQEIFRFSDSDLATYLLMLGYIPIDIEVKEDKKHNDRLKAFICFEGLRKDFIKYEDDYKNNQVKINLKDFSIHRQKINKMIKDKINIYKNSIKQVEE